MIYPADQEGEGNVGEEGEEQRPSAIDQARAPNRNQASRHYYTAQDRLPMFADRNSHCKCRVVGPSLY